MDETNTLIAQRQAKLEAWTKRPRNPFAQTVPGQENTGAVIRFPQLEPVPPPPANH